MLSTSDVGSVAPSATDKKFNIYKRYIVHFQTQNFDLLSAIKRVCARVTADVSKQLLLLLIMVCIIMNDKD